MMYATPSYGPFTAPDPDPKKQSMYQRIGNPWADDPSNPTTPRRDQYNPSDDPGFVPSASTNASVVKQGQPLRNDTSATAAATAPQPEIDAAPEDFVQPTLPKVSDGLGSASSSDQLSRLSGIEQDVQSKINKLSSDPNFQFPTAPIQPGLGRKILANVAGVAVGAFNPERGMNLRQSILDQPTTRAEQVVAMRRAPIETDVANQLKLAGITQEGAQRTAELNAAAARMKAAQNRGTQLENEAQGVETTEVGATDVNGQPIPGAKQRVTVNKIGGKISNIGAPMFPNNAEKAASYELKATADGRLVSVNKIDGTSTDTGLKVPAEKQTLANQWVESYKNTHNGNAPSPAEVVKAMTASAAQYGANKENDEGRKATLAANSESLANAIASHSEVLGAKDAASKYAAANKWLTSYMSAHPEDAEIESAVRKSLQQRYPGYNRAPSAKQRSTVTLPTNGVSGVTINGPQ